MFLMYEVSYSKNSQFSFFLLEMYVRVLPYVRTLLTYILKMMVLHSQKCKVFVN